MDWWALLRADTKATITAGIDVFASYSAFMAGWHLQRRKAVIFEGNFLGARWEEFRERLPQVDFERFLSLMGKPVADRKAYAEDFGIRTTRVLKDYLDVPSHRPKVKQSKADLADDQWLRRLAAYILNFPEKCR
jgi:hypothetical protein